MDLGIMEYSVRQTALEVASACLKKSLSSYNAGEAMEQEAWMKFKKVFEAAGQPMDYEICKNEIRTRADKLFRLWTE